MLDGSREKMKEGEKMNDSSGITRNICEQLKLQIDLLESRMTERKLTMDELMRKMKRVENEKEDLMEKEEEINAEIRQLKCSLRKEEREKCRYKNLLEAKEEEIKDGRQDTERLEKDLEKAHKVISSLESQLSNEGLEKGELKDEIERLKVDMKRERDGKEEEIEEIKCDLEKANGIILKLSWEVQHGRCKLDLLNKVACRQDQEVEKKMDIVGRLEEEYKACMERLRRKESESVRLEEQVEGLETNLVEAEEEIRGHENVIKWLNKQLEMRRKPEVHLSLHPRAPEACSRNRNTGHQGQEDTRRGKNGILRLKKNTHSLKKVWEK